MSFLYLEFSLTEPIASLRDSIKSAKFRKINLVISGGSKALASRLHISLFSSASLTSLQIHLSSFLSRRHLPTEQASVCECLLVFVYVWVLKFEYPWLWNMLNVSSEKISEEKEKGISGNPAVIPLTHLVDSLIFSHILIKDFE